MSGLSRWADAVLAARLLALDPEGLGGAVLRVRAGPVRDAWMALLTDLMPGRAMHRIPAGIGEEALSGGIDLAATLSAGRPVREAGLLARAEGGILVLPMAERADAGLAARLAAAMEAGGPPLILCDEGVEADETVPQALADRVAFRLDLDGLRAADCAEGAGPLPPVRRVGTPPELVEALTHVAAAFGIGSLRAPLLALRVARAAALLAGRDVPGQEEAEIAARLVLAPRATRMPASETEETEAPPPPPPPEEQPGEDGRQKQDGFPEEVLVEAVKAALPPELLALLAAGGARMKGGARGGAGQMRRTPKRGRPAGTVRGRPGGGARLDLVATLRAAAPWQPIRKREVPGRAGVQVRMDDLRLKRFKARAESAVLFAVDASGSAAMARLGEAKGAVQLLLGEAYVRREEVALIAFRGHAAELLLPPTRSLVQAKRRLDALPGGGATPLAAGLKAAGELAAQVRRRGATPFLALLTDGRGNVALDGREGRGPGAEDAGRMADAIRATGLGAVMIDISARPQPAAREFAARLGATYLALPRADSARLSAAIRAVKDGA